MRASFCLLWTERAAPCCPVSNAWNDGWACRHPEPFWVCPRRRLDKLLRRQSNSRAPNKRKPAASRLDSRERLLRRTLLSMEAAPASRHPRLSRSRVTPGTTLTTSPMSLRKLKRSPPDSPNRSGKTRKNRLHRRPQHRKPHRRHSVTAAPAVNSAANSRNRRQRRPQKRHRASRRAAHRSPVSRSEQLLCLGAADCPTAC